MPRVVPKGHPERPRGVPEGAWPAPAGGSGDRPVTRSGETVQREYLIAKRPVVIAGWYAHVGALLDPSIPEIARAAKDHAEWFGEAIRTEPRA